MNLLKQLTARRIGPDLWATHWLLHFGLGQRVALRKLAKCGRNVCLRPGCMLTDMDSIEIGDNVTIRPGTCVHACTAHQARVILENNVLMAPNVFIVVSDHNHSDPDTPIMYQGESCQTVTIREGAWLGANCTVLKGVTVGRNSVVAAGAVVTRDVPDCCVVAGVPARVISTSTK